jgi:ABC-type transport system substrate-binding protein
MTYHLQKILNHMEESFMSRKPVRFFLYAFLILGLVAAACTGGAQPTEAPPEDGGDTTTVEETEAPPALPDAPETISSGITLDPATTTDEDSLLVSGFLYNGLVAHSEDGSIVAALAIEWSVSDDGLDYVFDLRPDAIFQDGSLVTADAVMASFNRQFDPEHPLRGDASYDAWVAAFGGFKGELNEDETPVSSFDGIEKVDENTVLIHLHRQVPDLLEILASPAFAILNPVVLEAEGAAYGTQGGSVDGTGPYMLGEWTDEGLTLTPNLTYWGTPPTSDLVFAFE